MIGRLVCIALLSLAAACAPQARRDGAIELRYGSPYPQTHPFSQADIAWMKYVEAQAGGRLKIKPYWGGTLLSSDNAVLEVAHGVVDVGLVSPIYTRAGMKTIKIQAGFYEGAHTPAEQAAVYKCLMRKYPVLTEEMRGVHVLAVQGGTLPHVLTRERPVTRLEDFAGLRLRTPSEIAPLLKSIDADPVTMPMAEVYSALSKGMVDGVIAPGDTLRSQHFTEVARYVSLFNVPRGAYPARAISVKAWERLPPGLRKILEESQPYWEEQLDQKVTAAEAVGMAFGKKEGQTFVEPAPGAQQAFDALYNKKSLEHAATLPKDYVDGVAMFRDAQAIIAEIRASRPAC
jgi:TRAP-type C4-dicarboxylate transport system substrate-binding protein